MLDKKPIIRTNYCRQGCVIPVGWVLESILLFLLVCAVRDLSTNVSRIAKAVERLEKPMIKSQRVQVLGRVSSVRRDVLPFSNW